MTEPVATDQVGRSYLRGETTRRAFIQQSLALGLSGAAISALVAARGSSTAAAASGGPVTFVSWGGSFQEAETKAWLTPYTNSTGVKIPQDSPPDYSKIKAMVEARQVIWDVVDVEGEFGLAKDGAILEPIDYSVVSKAGLEGGASTYRVAFMTYSSVLGFNTAKTGGKTPASWADFFDLKAFPGKRGVPADAHDGLFEACMLASGVAPKDVYPIDVNRALAKLTPIKSQLVFTTSSAQKQDMLSTGETVMGFIGNGRAYAAKRGGHPVDVQWNGHIDFADYLVVPKGSSNKADAMKLIAYIVSPEHNGALSEFISYSPANTKATLPAAAKANELTSNYLNLPNVSFSDEYWATNYQTINDKYQAWKQS